MPPPPTFQADIEFALSWRDAGTTYRDRRLLRNVDVERDRINGQPLAALRQAQPGTPLTIATGVLPNARDPALCVSSAAADWPVRVAGQHIQPRVGRWFPRSLLAGSHGIAAGEREPMRVIDVTHDAIRIDLNPPLAGRHLNLDATFIAGHAGAAAEGRELLPQLVANGPGMQAALPDRPTDFLAADALARDDESADAEFYAAPRLVDHLDATALEQLRAVHARFLAPGHRVLDLMASCDSHLPAAPAGIEVAGLGLNAEEMARNPRLGERVVHDLNRDPALPFAAGSFDRVLCALSVEYLVRPLEVFAEVARVLKPGGIFLVSFSERWFPPKAIRLWSELHPFERIGLVLDHFRRSGEFADLNAESLRGWPRPRADKYIRMTALADPIYAVWGMRVAAGGQAVSRR